MSEGRSNVIFWIIGGIAIVMLAAAGAMLWISISSGGADGYIPPEERAEP